MNYLVLANEFSGYESHYLLGMMYRIGEEINDFTETLNALFKFAYQAFKRKDYGMALEVYHMGFGELFGRNYKSQGLYKDIWKEGEEVYKEIAKIWKRKLDIIPKKFKKKER